MAYYFYIAIDKNTGARHRGIITADDIRNAFEILNNINLLPERIYQIPGFVASLFRTKPYMKTPEMVEFLKGVGYALDAGVPLMEILVAFQEEAFSKKARRAIQEIAMKISQGYSMSHALRELKFFSPLILAFVEIGEATGQLGENLIKAAERIEFLEKLKSEAKKAMIYPLFVISVMIGAIFMWLFVIIPKISLFLSSLNIKLPSYTLFLINLSHNRVLLLKIFLTFFGTIFGLWFSNYLIKKFFSKENRVLYYKDALFLKLPVVGTLIYNYNHFLIASFLGALISAGVTITPTFNILMQSINNAVFYRNIFKIDELIRAGETLSEAFKVAGKFSPMFTRYIMVGERTGTLERQCDFLADYYRNKVDSTLALLPKLLEPILILFVGGIMLGMIFAVFMPIYSSISQVLKSVGG